MNMNKDTNSGGADVNRSQHIGAYHANEQPEGSLSAATATISVIAPAQYKIHPVQSSSSSSSPFESSSAFQATSGTPLKHTLSTPPKALQSSLPLNNSSLSGQGRSLEGDGKRSEDADRHSIRMNEGAVDAAATVVTEVEDVKAVQETPSLSPASLSSAGVATGALAGGGLGAGVGGVGGGNKGVYRRSSNPRKKSDDPSLCLFRPEEPSPRDCNSPSTFRHFTNSCIILIVLIVCHL